MILDFSNEIDEALQAIGVTGLSSKQTLSLAFVFAKVLDRGMSQERERVIRIVQRHRNVINPMEVVAEIRRPLR